MRNGQKRCIQNPPLSWTAPGTGGPSCSCSYSSFLQPRIHQSPLVSALAGRSRNPRIHCPLIHQLAVVGLGTVWIVGPRIIANRHRYQALGRCMTPQAPPPPSPSCSFSCSLPRNPLPPLRTRKSALQALLHYRRIGVNAHRPALTAATNRRRKMVFFSCCGDGLCINSFMENQSPASRLDRCSRQSWTASDHRAAVNRPTSSPPPAHPRATG
jgi:hypothetical protein